MIGQVWPVNLRASDRVPRVQRLQAVVAPVPAVAPSVAPATSPAAAARTTVTRRQARGYAASPAPALSSAHVPMQRQPVRALALRRDETPAAPVIVGIPPAGAAGPVTRRRARMHTEHGL